MSDRSPDTAAAHNLEHGSDVIKVTTPATAALSARSPKEPDLATVAGATVTTPKVDRLARSVPGGKVHHLVRVDGTTRCGHDTNGPFWAVWPISANRRVDLTPLCAACSKAGRA